MDQRLIKPRAPRSARAPQVDDSGDVPKVSRWWFDRFAGYSRGYLRRHFHTVRIARQGLPAGYEGKPVVVYLNHPAWWDPLIGILLAKHYFPDRQHYAPIEAKALGRYRFFEKIGFFGIEPGTHRGAAEFLRRSSAILAAPDSMLWVTAQGNFVDPRRRPVVLQQGVGHLAARLDHLALLPLAIEYPFWQERLPEALVRFGPVIDADKARDRTPAGWTERLGEALAQTQDALADDAQRQDPRQFRTLLEGRVGVGVFYDAWRRTKAWWQGESFSPGHGEPA